MQQNNSTSLKKSWLFKLITLFLPFIILLFIELILLAINYGNVIPLFIDMDGNHKTYKKINPYIAGRYFHKVKNIPTPSNDVFLKKKPANGYRIFVLGGSSAVGYPYAENQMFSRLLHIELTKQFKDKHIEIINTAMPAINSYTVLDFVPEIIEHKPDAVLIYAGHNEYYGALGVGSSEFLGKMPWLVNGLLTLKKLRTVQLILNLTHTPSKTEATSKNATLMERMAQEQSIAFNSETFYDGITQYTSNLNAIVAILKSHNIKIILSELVSNVRDQKPFVSLPSDSSANSLFKKAQLAEKAGQIKKAKKLYFNAKDRDALRFRAPEAFNSVIHKIAKNNNLPVVAMKSYFERYSGNNIIGEEVMVEHLHPNYKGYQIMARAFYDALKTEKEIALNWPKETPNFFNNKGFSQLDTTLANLRIKILTGGWPFKPKQAVNTALSDFKPISKVDSVALKVWQNKKYSLERAHVELAAYYKSQGLYEKAFAEYNALIYFAPYNASPYLLAAKLLLNANKPAMAKSYLMQSLKYEQNPFALKWVGQILLLQNQAQQALGYLHKAQIQTPNDTQLLYNLAGAYLYNKNLEKSLETLQHLEKIDRAFPGLQKLKSEVEKRLTQTFRE